MSEISFIFRSHPLLISILALGLSPVLVSALVIFSPILVTLLLFLLGIAGLARSTRRKLHRGRRRRKHHLQEPLPDEEELLRGEKQMRVNEYLEDQLRHLGDFSPLEESLLCGRLDESPGDSPEELGKYSDFRSDVSDFGDRSAEGLIPGDWENGE